MQCPQREELLEQFQILEIVCLIAELESLIQLSVCTKILVLRARVLVCLSCLSAYVCTTTGALHAVLRAPHGRAAM